MRAASATEKLACDEDSDVWETLRPVAMLPVTSRLVFSTLAIIAALAVAVSNSGASERDEITIDNAPFETVDGPIVLPVVAVRPIAGIHPVAAASLHEINFSKGLMVESAKQFPEIAKALETAGYDPNDPTWDQLKTAVEMSGYKERHLYGGSEADYEPRIVRSEFAPQEYQLWDATTIMNLWSTGAFDESTIMQHQRSGGEIIETIRFRKPYGQMMSGIYTKLSLIKYRLVEEASMWFAAVQDDVQQYDLMQQSLLAEVGEITFGTPIIYPAEEEGLTVPSSLSRNFDVYWARFNVTFRRMSPKDLLEMVVNYALPEGSVAMALFPFLHGSTVESRDEKGIPSVTAEYAGVKVAVGEAWKTSVYYKYLRPTVIAYGEGERIFSWAMSDEAMRAGSHRFNAIIGVPKGSDSVEIAMSAHVRLSQRG